MINPELIHLRGYRSMASEPAKTRFVRSYPNRCEIGFEISTSVSSRMTRLTLGSKRHRNIFTVMMLSLTSVCSELNETEYTDELLIIPIRWKCSRLLLFSFDGLIKKKLKLTRGSVFTNENIAVRVIFSLFLSKINATALS